MFKKCAFLLLAVVSSHEAMAGYLGFTPESGPEGTEVTYRWGFIGTDWHVCTLRGLPGGDISVSGSSGEQVFVPSSSLGPTIHCVKFVFNGGRANISASQSFSFGKYNFEPTIAIKYPDAVYVNDAHKLTVTSEGSPRI